MLKEDLSCFCANQDFTTRIIFPEENEHPYRDKFERDRDRILYSKSFRRLGDKTQIFITGYDDHMRNRLTHTLEVVQIAKTIAKSLGLNIALTEAIALAHDLGHTPFGHAGEQILNYIMNGCVRIKDFNDDLGENQKGFKHNWQGIKIITNLEQYNLQYKGLNLTDYTLWGVVNHTRKKWRDCGKKIENNGKIFCGLTHQDKKTCPFQTLSLGFYQKYNDIIPDTSFTVEALLVSWADEIAQRHHDLEDGLASGVISKGECLKRFKKIFLTQFSSTEIETIEKLTNDSQYNDWIDSKNYFIHDLSRLMINLFVTKLYSKTRGNLIQIKKKHKIKDNRDFHEKKNEILNAIDLSKDIVSFTQKFLYCHDSFKNYLKKRILNSYTAQSMDGKASYIIKQLFKAYITNPQQLPDKTIRFLLSNYYININKENKAKYVFLSHGIGFWRDKLEKLHYQNDTPEYKNAVLRTICDFISGMTDMYAFQQYEMLYGNKQLRNT